jgi:hypothetical protein
VFKLLYSAIIDFGFDGILICSPKGGNNESWVVSLFAVEIIHHKLESL